ncbi:MAG: hypothetical protein HY722_11210, partial [Planctomycetes bacterium]|nr:hypothetical protein [Planctomycetota bacterium]
MTTWRGAMAAVLVAWAAALPARAQEGSPEAPPEAPGAPRAPEGGEGGGEESLPDVPLENMPLTPEDEAGMEGASRREEELLSFTIAAGMDGGMAKVLVNGQAPKLPDGSTIYVSARYYYTANEPFDVVKAVVTEGMWSAVLGPYERPLYAGNYYVDALFLLDRQSGLVRDEVKRLRGEGDEWDRFERLHEVESIYFGFAADEEREEAARLEHYTGALKRFEQVYADLEQAVASTGRLMFQEEEAWVAWLVSRGYVKDPAGKAGSRKVRDWKDDHRFQNGERLDESAWRAWLDEDLRRRVAQLQQDHAAYQDRAAASKYPAADVDLGQLLGSLYRMTMDLSVEVYTGLGLEVHPNDQVGLHGMQPGVDAGSRARLFHQAELVLRRVQAKDVGEGEGEG